MSTKTKTKKLPAKWLLNKLPAAPDGYAYEYKGQGPFRPRPDWLNAAISSSSRLKSRGWLEGDLAGDSEQHYFALIKHPAPKPAAKGRKAVKARRGWASYDDNIIEVCLTGKWWGDSPQNKCAVLDISDEAALIEQAAQSIAEYNTAPGKEVIRVPCDASIARVVLESLGLIAKRRK
jgi:hypothetical protein